MDISEIINQVHVWEAQTKRDMENKETDKIICTLRLRRNLSRYLKVQLDFYADIFNKVNEQIDRDSELSKRL